MVNKLPDNGFQTEAELRNFIDRQYRSIRASVIIALFFEVPSLAVIVKLILASKEMDSAMVLLWIILGGTSITTMIVVGHTELEDIRKFQTLIAEAIETFRRQK